MEIQVTGIAFRAFTLISPLGLIACGGGDGPAACNNPNPAICAAVGSASSGSTGSNNANANQNSELLFTTAPAAITLSAGTSVTYGVGGGSPPYTATSGNINVGKATISDQTLSISGVAAGESPVAVVDSRGKTVTIKLTVAAQGQAGRALSIAPAAITVGKCTTNIPFIFSGGTPPYTVFSSANFDVPVSSPLPLDPSVGSFYFNATVQYRKDPKNVPGIALFTDTLTVLDSQSRTATVDVTTRVSSDDPPCPENPLKVFPESANFRESQVRIFQISGGTEPTVTFSNPSVAKYIRLNATEFNVQANNLPTGTTGATTLMTVTTNVLNEAGTAVGQQRANVVITVLPQP
ncbi:hypothetical protein [Acidovorax sp. SRB_24]|uniref:hypothetical protein n=1 Tax=Acidovorax sp. SRB_24 TaxID=1962700 RepID=UPI00145EF90B|nr:hypothetical protein [Acidovorax sp. SRB_24]